jgi:KDO2-lipid IV(A) lauroyltransferase
MAFLGYVWFRIAVVFLSILPFRVIYWISDVFYIFVYYIVGYRKKVVRLNLQNSFPEKNQHELRVIERKFFRFITDVILESLKGMSLGEKQIRKRHKVVNIEILDKHYNCNQSIIGVTGHYGNWEWGAYSGGVQLKHRAIAFYKPLTNKYLDRYVKNLRAKHNCTLASIKETYDIFSEYSCKKAAFIMAADQSPTNIKDCFWIDFLNQDTACLHGPEKYARMHNLPVYYIDIQPEKRGYYKLYLSPLCMDPKDLEPGKLTELYMRTLESKIFEKPEYWLWSHKRWKRKRS